MSAESEATEVRKRLSPAIYVVAALLVLVYWRALVDMALAWQLDDSYYSHGFLVPLVSAVLVWRVRKELVGERTALVRGYVWLLGGAALCVTGAYLGIRYIEQISMLPLMWGAAELLFGRRAKALLFPIAFLFFMIPLPASITRGVGFYIKILAADGAVWLLKALQLPASRLGSFITVGNAQLLVGEVCGGLRSLVALVAVGVLAAYFCRTRFSGKFLLIAVTVPAAALGNVLRIAFLGVVAHWWGVGASTGLTHDISGIMMFAVSLSCLFVTLRFLERCWPASAGDRECDIG